MSSTMFGRQTERSAFGEAATARHALGSQAIWAEAMDSRWMESDCCREFSLRARQSAMRTGISSLDPTRMRSQFAHRLTEDLDLLPAMPDKTEVCRK